MANFTESDNKILSCGKPADFSFRKMKTINVEQFLEEIGLEGVRYTRVAGVPTRGTNLKFMTKSILLNNNKLKTFKNMDKFANAILEYPEQLSWIDFSFNFLTEIDECILRFKSLKILYFHGNCITDFDQVLKLKPLKELRTVTFHGNPIANLPRYRPCIVALLPQLLNLDFSPVVPQEKLSPPPTEIVKKLARAAKK